MKKFIYGAVVLAVAAMMASCGGKAPQNVTEGDKSVQDTLSYSIGVTVGYGTTMNLPGVRLDWDEAIKGMKAGIKVPSDVKEDEKHKEAYATLEEFFMQKHQARMTEMREKLLAEDSTATFDPKTVDVFESNAERQEISYAYGYDFGFNVRASRLPLQIYWLAEGVKAGVADESGEANVAANDFMRHFYMEVLPAQNAERSAAWLAEVEKMNGVQKTESGLLYRIDRAGDESKKPVAEDQVKVDYEGKLGDGTIFDSSYERGEAIEFPLQGVIKGWTEGLQLVGVGGQITLWIPADLGYGPRGAGGLIGPNEALEFKVELHEITTEPVAEEPAVEVVEE